jgi:hypothetical protein
VNDPPEISFGIDVEQANLKIASSGLVAEFCGPLNPTVDKRLPVFKLLNSRF